MCDWKKSRKTKIAKKLKAETIWIDSNLTRDLNLTLDMVLLLQEFSTFWFVSSTSTPHYRKIFKDFFFQPPDRMRKIVFLRLIWSCITLLGQYLVPWSFFLLAGTFVIDEEQVKVFDHKINDFWNFSKELVSSNTIRNMFFEASKAI